MESLVRVYTDGACSGDGTGGWSWILVKDDDAVCFDLGRLLPATNQLMELVAVGKALRWLPPALDVTIVSDSAYVVNCFLQRWFDNWRENGWRNSKREPVANADIWAALIDLVESRAGRTEFEHVKGHNGDRWNEYADKLAVKARTTNRREP